jgi:hypothetical protein
MGIFDRGPIECDACQDTGHLRGEHCGCGFGVRHIVDCGKPARPCPQCMVSRRRKDDEMHATQIATAVAARKWGQARTARKNAFDRAWNANPEDPKLWEIFYLRDGLFKEAEQKLIEIIGAS